MSRGDENGALRSEPGGRERQVGDREAAFEGIGSGAEDDDVVIRIHGGHIGAKEARGAGGRGEHDVRLAAADAAEDMGGGDEIALVIDEEAVAVEEITIAAVGGGLVHGIDDGADGGGKSSVAGARCSCGTQSADCAGERDDTRAEPASIEFLRQLDILSVAASF